MSDCIIGPVRVKPHHRPLPKYADEHKPPRGFDRPVPLHVTTSVPPIAFKFVVPEVSVSLITALPQPG